MPSKSQSQDALALLKADHAEVDALFKQYEKLAKADGDAEERVNLAMEICTKLTVHATIEEEIFYPAAREALGEEEELIDEASVEHASAKDLIAQIEGGEADEPLYDARVKVLGEYIQHHVKEEEGEIFPKLKKAEIDLETLGAEMTTRKAELLQEAGYAE